MAPLKYRVLGPLEVLRDGSPVDLGPPKQRALLAVLALHAGRLVTTERIVHLLWGELPPRTAAHSVQVYVSALRRALGVAEIETRGSGYLLRAHDGQPDSAEFASLVRAAAAAARTSALEEAEVGYERALALWRGEPLADLAAADVAPDEVRQLHDLRLEALEGLAAVWVESGRAGDAVSLLRTAIAADPLREHLHALLMLGLYRTGRQAEALRVYQDFHRRLDDELGLLPTAELQQLQEQVLVQDPGLLPGTWRRADGDPSRTRNPFKGLRAFEEQDAPDYFGRAGPTRELVATLVTTARPLVAVVGPSGSGKSSLVRAGLLPLLRRSGEDGPGFAVAVMVPGRHPFEQLGAALRGAGVTDEDSPDLTGDGLRRTVDAAPPPPDRRVLVVVDQLEELFTQTPEVDRQSFLDAVVAATASPRLRVLVVLRADFYDRPYAHPAFARLFSSEVVTLTPLTSAELEQAATGPASRAGVQVEPALLAELVSQTAASSGALPQFQYVLSELFEGRDGDTLTLAAYRRLGGLGRAIADGAERLYGLLTDEQQQVTRQVVLRLASSVRADATGRTVPVRELLDLDVDPVALTEVLDVFPRHRLLTLDRDPSTGAATVGVAHEALLREWPRARDWLETHAEDLRRRDSLDTAMAEWEASGRHPDFLLTGERLGQFETWSRTTGSGLTAPERQFLQGSTERRLAAAQEDADRRHREQALARRARRRLWALGSALTLLVAVVSFAVVLTRPEPAPQVVLAGDLREDALSGQLFTGFEGAADDLGLRGQAVELATDDDLRALADRGVDFVVSGPFLPADVLGVAADFPRTDFVIVDAAPGTSSPPNVSLVTFEVQEGAFLAGAAAALTTTTGRVGFVGGADEELVRQFQAGFEAGVAEVDPSVAVDVVYLGETAANGGFSSSALGLIAGLALYEAGADVVFHAAGTSGVGVFRAAYQSSQETGRHVWGIGVDYDQYPDILQVAPEAIAEDAASHVLTSVVKRLDVAVAEVLRQYAQGATLEDTSVGLDSGGMELARSGGFIDGIADRLDALAAEVSSGEIAVARAPSLPATQLTDYLRD